MNTKMKITKRQLRRIIREEKQKLLNEAIPGPSYGQSRLSKDFNEQIPRDDRTFLKAMETIMDQLMILEPRARIQNAESLIMNLETVIDQAKQG